MPAECMRGAAALIVACACTILVLAPPTPAPAGARARMSIVERIQFVALVAAAVAAFERRSGSNRDNCANCLERRAENDQHQPALRALALVDQALFKSLVSVPFRRCEVVGVLFADDHALRGEVGAERRQAQPYQ
jgi:hypothetical protein